MASILNTKENSCYIKRGIVFGFFLYLPIFFLSILYVSGGTADNIEGAGLFLSLLGLPTSLILNFLPTPSIWDQLYYLFLFSFINYILIGGVVGFLIGLIKNKFKKLK